MRSRSARFDRVIRASHQMATEVDVMYNRLVIAHDLQVVRGLVTFDRSKAVMASCSVTFAEPTYLPELTGPLTPYGYELVVRRGLAYGDGEREMMGLGVFPIQQADVDGVGLTTSATAFDRSQLVIDARMEDDYPIAAGTNYGTALRSLIEAGVPALTYLFPSTSFTTPALVIPMGDDRWQHAQKMAAAIGWELYFDGVGRCVARPEPSLAGATPLWEVNEGADGVLMSVGFNLDRRPAYNKVVASGENTTLGAVFRGEASDDNPLSPTYYLGGFGRKPLFHVSPLYTSDAQCIVAAQARLATVAGVARSLQLATVPQPALEPGDAITVRRTALGVDELHLIDAMTIGLGAADAMSISTRTVQ